jgi:hypothetical protein
MFCAYWELHKYLHVLVHIEGCTWFSNVGWFQGLRKYLHVLVLIQGCSWFSICWPVLGAGRVSARVITFREQGMQLRVCVCVCGKAGSCYVECSVYEALRVGAACICVYQVQSWYLRLLPCIESGACMRVACICMYLLLVCTFMHWGLDIFLHVTYQELGVYLHASSHFKPCARM